MLRSHFIADWKGGKKLRINYPDADIVDRTVQFQSANNIGVRSYLALGHMIQYFVDILQNEKELSNNVGKYSSL